MINGDQQDLNSMPNRWTHVLLYARLSDPY